MLDFRVFELLTFDCYGTLINWEAGILSVFHQLLSNHRKTIDDSTILRLYGDFEEGYEQQPFRPYREVLASVVRQFGDELGFAPSEEEERSLADSLPTWEPWPDTVASLRQLKSRYQLAIVSNVDDSLFAATRPKLGVDFDVIVTAEQARAYKPSLKMFEAALTRSGVPPHRVLHAGQSLYHDVVPAQSLGMAAVWVNRPSIRKGLGAVKAASAQPDLTVSSLEQLAGMAMQS
jgi:2-haloacid dehalogenase